MQTVHDALAEHLRWWGLRRFESDAAYFQWQRETLAPGDLTRLNQLVDEKRRPQAGPPADVAFYDFSARPQILSALYSQRYDYYMAVGALVADRIGSAKTVLDFGCGVGILTTFYARHFPTRRFIGVDRSGESVAVARQRASALGLTNVRFETVDVERTALADLVDLLVSSHALVQAEGDPGLPSADWETFDRWRDAKAQTDFEARTGLGPRLNALTAALAPEGRMIVFEKTRQLARRVPFQRALSSRGLFLLERPIPIRYRLVEEVTDDGPLYMVTRTGPHEPAETFTWDEQPDTCPEDGHYACHGKAARAVWQRLPDRRAERTETWKGSRLGDVTAQWGTFDGALGYLFVTTGDRVHGLVVGSRETIGMADQTTDTIKGLLASSGSTVESEADLAYLPLYENHTAMAQAIWSRLPDRTLLRHTTVAETGGRETHVELGTVPGLVYLYWANTFDQRQLVMVEQARAEMLEQYYQEFLDSRSPSQ